MTCSDFTCLNIYGEDNIQYTKGAPTDSSIKAVIIMDILHYSESRAAKISMHIFFFPFYDTYLNKQLIGMFFVTQVVTKADFFFFQKPTSSLTDEFPKSHLPNTLT